MKKQKTLSEREEELKKEIEEKKRNNMGFIKKLYTKEPKINIKLLMEKDRFLIELAQSEAKLQQLQEDKKCFKEAVRRLKKKLKELTKSDISFYPSQMMKLEVIIDKIFGNLETKDVRRK